MRKEQVQWDGQPKESKDGEAASEKELMHICQVTCAAYGSRAVAEQHIKRIREVAVRKAAKTTKKRKQTNEYSKGATQHYCSTAFANS